jgi:hypothetical protein
MQWLRKIDALVETQRGFEVQLDERLRDKLSEVTCKAWMVPPWLSPWLSQEDVSQLQAQLSGWRTSLEDQEENIKKWRATLERGFHDNRHPDARFRSVEAIIKDEELLVDRIFKRWHSIMQVVERTEGHLKQEMRHEAPMFVVPEDSGWKAIAII